MDIRYYKEYSHILERDMEFKIFGNGGKLCLAFAPQDGRFFDFAENGMVDCVSEWIERGMLTIACPDSLDQVSWSDAAGDGRYRAEQQERWFAYVTDELLPRLRELTDTGVAGKAMTTGCSMGAVHAGNFFFRRPDLFDTVVTMSGTYNASYFFGDYMDDLVYANSPCHFLRNMPEDHPWMALYRQSRIIICIGQGAWEDSLLPGTRELDAICKEKGIPAWFDYWGFDVNHDWPWWRRQFPYFMEHLMQW